MHGYYFYIVFKQNVQNNVLNPVKKNGGMKIPPVL